MKRSLLVALLLFLLPWTALAAGSADSLLRVLKQEIARKDIYDKQKEKHISLLRTRVKASIGRDLNARYAATEALFEAYRDYKFDSTFYYAQQLIELSNALHDRRKLTDNKIRLGFTLIASGMLKETFDCIRDIDRRTFDTPLKRSYYVLSSWAWSDLAKYNADRFYAPEDWDRKFRYLDSAIALTEKGSFEQYILMAQRKPGTGPHPVYFYTSLLKRKISPHEEAMVSTGLSQYRNGDEKLRLLAIAAINDVRTSTYRAQAISDLGQTLYDYGRIDEAYYFMQQAMGQANRFGARMQRYQVSKLLSTIAAKRDIKAERERQRFVIYLFVIIAVAAIIGLVCFIVFVQLKKLRAGERIILDNNRLLEQTNSKLWEEGRIKEEYIGFFFTELSRHIVKIDKLKKNIQRKAKTGTPEEIIKMLDGVDVNGERNNLYHTFDKIFLKLFPDFVEAINAMLRPEDQLKPKVPGTLTAHLRIFALMRLGIDNNETIAAILEYSVTTVYTYRFRLRTKALVPAEEFEKRIMGIQISTDQAIKA